MWRVGLITDSRKILVDCRENGLLAALYIKIQPVYPRRPDQLVYPPAAARRPVMFDPDAHMPRINRGMVYLGACLIVVSR
jgi:hypothetical protein